MNEEFVVTVGGMHGSGRSTVAKSVAEHYGLDRFSTGDVFRKFAKERGMSVREFDEKAEKEVDLEVDRQSREAGEKGKVVFESDLAAWVNKDIAGKTVLKIWLNASAETGGKRIFNDEKNRTSEKYATEEEAVEEIKKRNTADRNRYITVYKVEIYPNSESVEGIEQVEYDKIVDADSITTEQVKQEIFEFLNEKGLKPSKKLIN